MSAFNILEASAKCPNCSVQSDFEIQFKYGNTWQLKYKIGEKLEWGGNDIGKQDAKEVFIEGIGGPCSNCGAQSIEFDIHAKKGCLKSVSVVGLERPNPSSSGYRFESEDE